MLSFSRATEKPPGNRAEGRGFSRADATLLHTFNRFDCSPWIRWGLKPHPPARHVLQPLYLTVSATGALWVTVPEVPLIVSV